MDRDDTLRAGEHLFSMRTNQRVEADLPTDLKPADLAEAYAIQEVVVDRLTAAAGGSRIGYKVACTNKIAQDALMIDRPVYGQMLSHSTHAAPATLTAADFTTRVIEAEFGIRIGTTVPDGSGPHTATSIAEYVDAVIPSIEVVDHRFVDWSVGALSVAADNAIHGCWVPGEPFDGDWTALDLEALAVTVTVDGEVETTGTGSAVLGHPLNVVAFLADELPKFGRRLEAGDLITTGVCTDVFEAQAGQNTTADFGPLGTVSITWT